ncbi:PucR family transcriptional regulator [Streptomyces sp. NPDC014734]|uniref:PucR family transcriptional regulator n=1 Tax=Streptomyces sp. NPDC014734 TaxID=3364886 RepID=UPI0036FE77F6
MSTEARDDAPDAVAPHRAAPEPEITVPLREIAELPGLGLEVLAGHELLDREVRWAHVSELADPAPYLDGGELLLSAGLNLPDDPDLLRSYARALADSGVAALGFGLAPVHSEAPAVLVEACERYGLPLLTVPRATPFLAVSRAVADALEGRRADQQRGLAEAQSRITRAALHGVPPVPAVLAAMADAADCWAVLLDSRGNPVRTAGGAPEPGRDLVDLALRLGRGSGPRSATHASGGVHVDLHPIASLHGRPHVLLLGRSRPFTAPDRTLTAVCVGLLGLLAESERVTGTRHSLMTRLLLGERPAPSDPGSPEARPSRVERLLRALLDTDEPEPVRVLRGIWAPTGRGTPRPDDATVVIRALGSPLVDLHDGQLCAIVPADTSPDRLTALHTESGWLTALSRPVAPDRLPSAGQDARLLLERAVASGTPLVSRAAGHGVGELLEQSQAAAWARTALGPLLDEVPDGPELVRLLRVWLACHGSWDRTAQTTDMHRNSVRHRVNRIQRLLGADLSDPDTRAQLWLALTWYEP